ncbi:hypothetical protein Plhal304r1_c030g0096911 [Plasmopara halstedii]
MYRYRLRSIKRWLSMPNRFVLSRNYNCDESHVQLFSDELVHRRRSDGRIGVPIASSGSALRLYCSSSVRRVTQACRIG